MMTLLMSTGKRLRRTFRKIRATIAVARLHELRDELIRADGVATGRDATNAPRAPLILGENWDF